MQGHASFTHRKLAWEPIPYHLYEQSSLSFIHGFYLKQAPPCAFWLMRSLHIPCHAAIRFMAQTVISTWEKVLYVLQTHSTYKSTSLTVKVLVRQCYSHAVALSLWPPTELQYTLNRRTSTSIIFKCAHLKFTVSSWSNRQLSNQANKCKHTIHSIYRSCAISKQAYYHMKRILLLLV